MWPSTPATSALIAAVIVAARNLTTLRTPARFAHPVCSLGLKQAAKFADPQGECLALKGGSAKPPQNLGPFTCVADGLFFVRAVTLALGYLSLILVDVGNPSSPAGAVVGAAALFGPTTEQELNLELQVSTTTDRLVQSIY